MKKEANLFLKTKIHLYRLNTSGEFYRNTCIYYGINGNNDYKLI